MRIKRHVLFVVSGEPINLESLALEKRGDVDHLINEELDIESTDGGFMAIEKLLPAQTRKECECPYFGKGRSVSTAIADFLLDVCGSVRYDPLRDRRKREREREASEGKILKAFAELVYNLSDHSPGFEFRLPRVGEEVFVQHGFFRNGRGMVKSVDSDSPDEKVVVVIRGTKLFEVSYTYNEKSSHWECTKGKDKIDSGASLATYAGGDGEVDPNKFTFIYPPTEEARKYWSEPRKTA